MPFVFSHLALGWITLSHFVSIHLARYKVIDSTPALALATNQTVTTFGYDIVSD